MILLASSRDMNLTFVPIMGFLACWFLGLVGLVKARCNVQPGVKWWSIMVSNRRYELERTFTPKGLFWLRVSQAAVIAGFAFGVFGSIAAKWWR